VVVVVVVVVGLRDKDKERQNFRQKERLALRASHTQHNHARDTSRPCGLSRLCIAQAHRSQLFLEARKPQVAD
jgi:hypothetical protein